MRLTIPSVLAPSRRCVKMPPMNNDTPDQEIQIGMDADLPPQRLTAAEGIAQSQNSITYLEQQITEWDARKPKSQSDTAIASQQALRASLVTELRAAQLRLAEYQQMLGNQN